MNLHDLAMKVMQRDFWTNMSPGTDLDVKKIRLRLYEASLNKRIRNLTYEHHGVCLILINNGTAFARLVVAKLCPNR